MSLEHPEKSEDLTTDAFPNPRKETDENKPKKSSDHSDNKESQFEEIYTNRAHTRKTKTRGFTRVKSISPPTAYTASIININNSSHIHVGTNITYNLQNESEKLDKEEVVETCTIKSLRINSSPVSQEDLLFIATHMDERWRDVGRALNFSDGQIEQFFLNHNNYGIKEVIYQLLLDWYRNEPTKPTVGKVSTILWEQNQKEVVKRWAEELNSSNK